MIAMTGAQLDLVEIVGALAAIAFGIGFIGFSIALVVNYVENERRLVRMCLVGIVVTLPIFLSLLGGLFWVKGFA